MVSAECRGALFKYGQITSARLLDVIIIVNAAPQQTKLSAENKASCYSAVESTAEK